MTRRAARFGRGNAPCAQPEVGEHRLQVQRHGIVHGRRDALRLHPRFDCVALVDFDRVLRVHARAAGRQPRRHAPRCSLTGERLAISSL